MVLTRTHNTPASPGAVIEARLVVTKADKAAKDKKKRGKKKNEENEIENDEDSEVPAPAKAAARKTPPVLWSKPRNHHFSDAVLTIIEASAPMKVCFGLDKGDVTGPVNSGGKKAKDHHATIARGALLESVDSTWLEEDMPALITAVKNRIPLLKSGYINQKNGMSLTGQGLVHSGRTNEMIDGSEVKNIWDKVMVDFPWYERMHALMGTSPVATRAAVAHSASSIDTSVLSHTTTSDRGRSPSWDPHLGLSRPPSVSPTPNSHAGSPSLDEEADADADCPSAAPLAPTPAPSVSKKRKSLADAASDIAGQERSNRRKISEDLSKEKTARSLGRERVKREAHMDVEVARMAHDKDEADARRAHELVMMDKQMEMEQFRAGHAVAGPSNPTQNQMLDPGLWSHR